ncbi:MAG: type II toxin-antitoxin system YafQ family toxin [bacterium]
MQDRFKKDFKRVLREGKDKNKILAIMYRLAHEDTLEPEYRDHRLTGKLSAYRECHLEYDWLLMYRIIRKRNNFCTNWFA